ncbi:MAG: GAF domain-containing protein [Azospirillaceae bacterium]
MNDDVGNREIAAEIRRIRYQNRFVITGISLILPTLIGIYSNFVDDIVAISPFLFFSVVGLLLVLQLGFTLVVLNADPHALSLYAKNTRLLEENRTGKERLARAEALLRHGTTSRVALTASLTVAGVSMRNGIRSRAELVEAVGDALDPIVESAGSLLGIEPDELWSFALYLPEDASDALVSIWRRKADGHPGSDRGRPWPIGIGHVGITFRSGATTIIADMGEDGVPESIRNPPGQGEPYDATVYRSLAAFPVMFDDDPRPKGVLAVTSDRPGRLTEQSCLPLKDHLPILATLLHSADSADSASDSREMPSGS